MQMIIYILQSNRDETEWLPNILLLAVIHMSDKYIFISYSSRDNEYVNQITEALKKAGIAYWKAPDMISAGSNYAKEIPKAISDCSVFLLVLSKTAQESMWVEKEIDKAICSRKIILPVRIDDCELNDLFKFYLNNVQMYQADISNGKVNDIDQIMVRIEDILKQHSKTPTAQAKEGEAPGHNESVIKSEPPALDEVSTEQEKDSKSWRRNATKRHNALRMNKIPVECEFCGGDIDRGAKGEYICVKCGKENFDDFNKIRNYIQKYGPAPAIVVSRNTGVPMATIEYFRANGDVKDVRNNHSSGLW